MRCDLDLHWIQHDLSSDKKTYGVDFFAKFKFRCRKLSINEQNDPDSDKVQLSSILIEIRMESSEMSKVIKKIKYYQLQDIFDSTCNMENLIKDNQILWSLALSCRDVSSFSDSLVSDGDLRIWNHKLTPFIELDFIFLSFRYSAVNFDQWHVHHRPLGTRSHYVRHIVAFFVNPWIHLFSELLDVWHQTPLLDSSTPLLDRFPCHYWFVSFCIRRVHGRWFSYSRCTLLISKYWPVSHFRYRKYVLNR